MKEGKLRIYGILFMLVFVFIFIFGVLIHDLSSAIAIFFVSLMFAVSYWEIARWVVVKACVKMPGLLYTKKRIHLIIRYLLPCAIILPIGQMEILQLFNIIFFSVHNYWNYVFYFGLNLISLAVVIVLYESIYYIQNWKMAFAESERMKKINLTSQYQFLKDQIKPHFLFNSLNTLASLIQINQAKAEEFVEEMSTVYRYLLSKKEIELAPLKDELAFLRSYIVMLKTRFAESLNVHIDTETAIDNYFLPPFVLQLLVENAVKHNTVSIENPLTVEIVLEKEALIIRNNIQKKKISEPSEKTGLMNLISRYKLLNKEHDLILINDGKTFTVILPLIKKQTNPYYAY